MAPIVAFYTDAPVKGPDGSASIHVDQFHVSQAPEFEIGYPETGIAYVRHPIRPKRLVPVASYHPQLMLEKVNEAISMVTALGANSIELAYTNNGSSDVRPDVELMFGLVNLGTKVTKGETTVVYTANGGGAAPRTLPPMLWIDQPGWRGIIDGRLNARLEQFALSFTYEHRTGVDAELAAAVKRFGLRAGGDFKRAHKVSFSLKGAFPDGSGFRRR